MTVQAKFYVSEVTQFAGDNVRVKLAPVCRGEENKEWSKYTPSGQIEMTVNNKAASDQFIPGREYTVTFEQVVPPKPERSSADALATSTNKHGLVKLHYK